MGASNNASWRHHHLPQFYLRAFADVAGKVWRTFLGPNAQLHQRSFAPKQTGYEEHLYSLKPQVVCERISEPDKIETKFLAPLDDRAAVAFRELFSKAPSVVSDAHRRNWAVFMNSLLERAPGRINEREETARAVIQGRLKEFLGDRPDREWWARLVRQLHLEAMAGNTVRAAMVSDIADPAVVEYFAKMSWVKARVVTGQVPFVTGDAPVAVNAGTAGPIHTMTIALSPTDLLMMSGPTLSDEVLGMMALVHNLVVIGQSRYVYSNAPLSDHEVVKTRLAAQMSLKAVEWRNVGSRSS